MSSFIIEKGDYGNHVIELQKALNNVGLWPKYIPYSKNFGPTTDKVVRKFQKINGLVVDGKVGKRTMRRLNVNINLPKTGYGTKYKSLTIQGSSFPDSPIYYNKKIRFNKEIIEEYIPAMESVMENDSEGLKALMTIMAYKEGYRIGTRSYRTNNPGNIGNVDSGRNKFNSTLKDGIKLQRNYILNVANNKHEAYPLGEVKVLRPFFSKEIAKNFHVYGLEPYVPGYRFVYDGRLEQFVKIYATGSRASNGYLSMILSYFMSKGYSITPKTTISEIINLN